MPSRLAAHQVQDVARARFQDREFLRKFQEVERLPDEDKELISRFLETLLFTPDVCLLDQTRATRPNKTCGRPRRSDWGRCRDSSRTSTTTRAVVPRRRRRRWRALSDRGRTSTLWAKLGWVPWGQGLHQGSCWVFVLNTATMRDTKWQRCRPALTYITPSTASRCIGMWGPRREMMALTIRRSKRSRQR